MPQWLLLAEVLLLPWLLPLLVVLVLELVLASFCEYVGGVPKVGPDAADGFSEYAGGGDCALGRRVGGEGFMRGLRKIPVRSPSVSWCLLSLLLARDDEDTEDRRDDEDENGFRLLKKERRLVRPKSLDTSSGLNRLGVSRSSTCSKRELSVGYCCRRIDGRLLPRFLEEKGLPASRNVEMVIPL